MNLPDIPIVLDSPFEARYDKHTGTLIVKAVQSELSTGEGQISAEIHISPAALLRLQTMTADLERDAQEPPSTHVQKRNKH